jgi:hypothetical protein
LQCRQGPLVDNNNNDATMDKVKKRKMSRSIGQRNRCFEDKITVPDLNEIEAARLAYIPPTGSYIAVERRNKLTSHIYAYGNRELLLWYV